MFIDNDTLWLLLTAAFFAFWGLCKLIVVANRKLRERDSNP
jgi:hypothetical protein